MGGFPCADCHKLLDELYDAGKEVIVWQVYQQARQVLNTKTDADRLNS